jgi:hypothetical protein
MTLITLHEYLNPTKEMYQDMDDISNVTSWYSGSCLTLKESGVRLFVHESPSDILEMMKGAL